MLILQTGWGCGVNCQICSIFRIVLQAGNTRNLAGRWCSGSNQLSGIVGIQWTECWAQENGFCYLLQIKQ